VRSVISPPRFDRSALDSAGDDGMCWVVLYTSKKYSETTHLSILTSLDRRAIEQTFKRKAMPIAAWLIEGGLDSPVIGKIERSLRARFRKVDSTQVVNHFRSGVREHGAPHNRPIKELTYSVTAVCLAERISEITGSPPQFGTTPIAPVSPVAKRLAVTPPTTDKSKAPRNSASDHHPGTAMLTVNTREELDTLLAGLNGEKSARDRTATAAKKSDDNVSRKSNMISSDNQRNIESSRTTLRVFIIAGIIVAFGSYFVSQCIFFWILFFSGGWLLMHWLAKLMAREVPTWILGVWFLLSPWISVGLWGANCGSGLSGDCYEVTPQGTFHC
jgi:hypothetical protein